MAQALSVTIIANIDGKKIPWEKLGEEKKREVATKLHSEAMRVAGYEKSSDEAATSNGA